ncbi:MAG: ComEC/Rec2 family competence protein, partial [Acidobacteria bacterium]
MDVESIVNDGASFPARGGVRLTVAGGQAAAQAGAWRAGRRLRLTAGLRLPTRYLDPGVRDARLGSARRGTILTGGVKSASLVELVQEGSALDEAAASIRRHTRDAISRQVAWLSPRSAAIVVAILIGDRVGLDDEVERRLQEAGTYHVIAISGGNIAILAASALFVLRVLAVGRRAGSLLVILLLAAYAFLVRGEASVTRATLMAVIFLLSRLGDFRGSPANTLSISAVMILVAWPQAVFDVGAYLTFGATIGILLGARLMPERLSATGQPPSTPWWRAGYVRVPLGLLMASVCAELALLPLSALVFFRVTFAGLFLNFAAIPLMTVVQIAGMLVVPLDLVCQPGAMLAGRVAHLAAKGLVESASLLDILPWLSFRLPPPHWLVVAAYYFGWVARVVIPAGTGWPPLTWLRR